MTELTGSVQGWREDADSDSRWQYLLDSYCYYENRYKSFIKWRALAYVILVYSVVNLIYLLDSSSHFHNAWFVGSLFGIAITTPTIIYFHIIVRKVKRRRKALSREMFYAGFRVDDEQRLVTDNAHPKVVAAIKNTTESQ